MNKYLVISITCFALIVATTHFETNLFKSKASVIKPDKFNEKEVRLWQWYSDSVKNGNYLKNINTDNLSSDQLSTLAGNSVFIERSRGYIARLIVEESKWLDCNETESYIESGRIQPEDKKLFVMWLDISNRCYS